MLFDQVAQKRPEGVALFLFRQNAGNIARDRIGSSGTDLPLDSGELMLRQADGDLRSGHTTIIPLTGRLAKPPRALNLLREWAMINEDELVQDWNLCREKALPSSIEPLA